MHENIALIKRQNGFTLVELMIVVAIVGILASVVYPSYTGFILRSDRTEAQRELIRFANLQEQLFVDRRSYSNLMTDLGELLDPYVTPSDNYSITATIANNGTTYVLTATAVGSQLRDTDCPTLTINEVGQQGALSPQCWED